MEIKVHLISTSKSRTGTEQTACWQNTACDWQPT